MFDDIPSGGTQDVLYGGRTHRQKHNDSDASAESLQAKLGIGASVPTNVGDVLGVTAAGTTSYAKRGLVPIAQVSGTGASGIITISGLPTTYDELEINIWGRSDTAATSAFVKMTLNGNVTATDYDAEFISATGATPNAGEALGVSAYLNVGLMPAASSSASLTGSIKVWLPQYANTGGFKGMLALSSGTITLTAGNLLPQLVGGAFESTAAISSITLTLSAGNWTTVSRVTVWGKMGS